MTMNVLVLDTVLKDGVKELTLVMTITKSLTSFVIMLKKILKKCTAKVVILNGMNTVNLTVIVITLEKKLS
jgi:hypothetical protein